LRVAVIVAVWSEDKEAAARVNVAEEALPGMAMEEGTVRACVLLVRAAESPDAGAALERVTVQEVLELASKFVVSHCREERTVAETRATEVSTDEPLSAAVTVAFWSEEKDAVRIVNAAEEVLAGTATDGGTERLCTLLVRPTDASEEGAAFERVTVQELLELAVRLADAHCRAVTTAGAISATEVDWEDPFSVAVRVIVSSKGTEAAATGNVAEDALAGTATKEGTVRMFEVEVRATLAPAVPAGALRVVVHVEVADGPRLDGLQDRAVTVSGGTGAERVMAPPVGETGRESPAGEAARALLRPMRAVVALGVKTTDTTPTIPLAIVLALSPETMQMYAVDAPAHEMFFSSAAAAGPVATEILSTLAAG
jgi:hypothetical protein